MKVFTPANGTIMVLRDEVKEKKTEGGIYIADRAIELANEGEVRASCDGSQYQPGDRVIFTKYAGSEFELNGVTYLLLKEKEIQGLVREVASPLDRAIQTADDVAAAAQEALVLLEKEAQNR